MILAAQTREATHDHQAALPALLTTTDDADRVGFGTNRIALALHQSRGFARTSTSRGSDDDPDNVTTFEEGGGDWFLATHMTILDRDGEDLVHSVQLEVFDVPITDRTRASSFGRVLALCWPRDPSPHGARRERPADAVSPALGPQTSIRSRTQAGVRRPPRLGKGTCSGRGVRLRLLCPPGPQCLGGGLATDQTLIQTDPEQVFVGSSQHRPRGDP